MAIGGADAVLPDVLGGRYRPLGVVGHGAIAEVVRARDERTGREVALKIIYPHLRENAAVAERFKREVEIVRRIAHPHVLAIHDVVEDAGRLFLVMDFHGGGDLADRLARRGRLPPQDLAVLAAELCGALGAAHRAGVVHRDVKPSNVLCGVGEALDLRLCDFGLARTSELAGLTTANAVLGTPEYMAPEVITDGHADPRSDVYSLGVVLYEAATGKLPFHGDSPYQLMRQHVDVEAPRAAALAPGLPPSIDGAIARALAKDPLDRFATVEDLARAFTETRSDVTALARREVAVAARKKCPRCGGWLVDAAATCADCGVPMLRLDPEPRGMAVVVKGPGRVGDKVDAWRHVALYKALEQIPAGTQRAPLPRSAPRYPFLVAKNLTGESAVALVERLKPMGLEATLVPRSPLFFPGVGKRVSALTVRYFAGAAMLIQTHNLWTHIFPKPWRLFGAIVPFALLGVGMVAVAIRTTVRSVKALVTAARPRGPLGEGRARLARALPALEARQDRRLLARVLERLEQVDQLGHGQAAEPLALRAAEVAEALAALETRRRHDASTPRDPAGAQSELRREERARVLLRAFLLRATSRLDDLALAATRADAAATAGEVNRLAEELGGMGDAVEAEEELAGLLRGAS